MSSSWYQGVVTYFQFYFTRKQYAQLTTSENRKENSNPIAESKHVRHWSDNQLVVILLLSAIVAGTLGFLGGIQFYSSQTRTPTNFGKRML